MSDPCCLILKSIAHSADAIANVDLRLTSPPYLKNGTGGAGESVLTPFRAVVVETAQSGCVDAHCAIPSAPPPFAPYTASQWMLSASVDQWTLESAAYAFQAQGAFAYRTDSLPSASPVQLNTSDYKVRTIYTSPL